MGSVSGGRQRAPKPGYEDVDAEAFDIAGAQLAKAKLRSRVTLKPGKAVALPTHAVRLSASECVLAVAERGQPALRLSLGSTGLGHGDLRGGAKAAVEVCPGEHAEGVPPLALEAKETGGAVRWALYTTRATGGGAGGAR